MIGEFSSRAAFLFPGGFQLSADRLVSEGQQPDPPHLALPAKKQRDPFNTASSSSGRTMNGKRKPLQTGRSRKELEKRFPALRRGP